MYIFIIYILKSNKPESSLFMAARQLAGRRPLYFTADVSILLLYFFLAG